MCYPTLIKEAISLVGAVMETKIYTQDQIRLTATQYRLESKRDTGIVLTWNNKAYGWRDTLRDANTERSGAIAVDEYGLLYQAKGDNYQDGTKTWVVVNKDITSYVINEEEL